MSIVVNICAVPTYGAAYVPTVRYCVYIYTLTSYAPNTHMYIIYTYIYMYIYIYTFMSLSRSAYTCIYTHTYIYVIYIACCHVTLQTPEPELSGHLSPDGKWLAYGTNESGRSQVYVRAFSGDSSARGGKWQVSSDGGVQPRWRGDGNEIYYLKINGRVMAAAINRGPTGIQVGTPRELFTAPLAESVDGLFMYDVSADGQRQRITSPWIGIGYQRVIISRGAQGEEFAGGIGEVRFDQRAPRPPGVG